MRETLEMDQDEVIMPWLNVFTVQNMYDYTVRCEVYSGFGNGEVINFDNAEQLMLKEAKDVSEGICEWL